MTRKTDDYLRKGFNIVDTIPHNDWYRVEALLKPYPKFLSVASMASVKLPVMPLLVYTEWNKDVEKETNKFVTKHGLTKVQVRSQAIGHSLGGKAFYHWPVDRIREASLELFEQDAAIVGIQLPGNIYRNDYSVHLDFNRSGFDFDRSGFRMYLEIVGPGFTATHLSKGGLMHERVCIQMLSAKFQRVFAISDRSYRENVAVLVNKYGMDRLVANHSLLLTHQYSYSPVPSERITYMRMNLRRIERAISRMNFESDRAIVAMSWIKDVDSPISRPVFWDIHESPTGTKFGPPLEPAVVELPWSGIERLIAEYKLEKR